MDIVEALTEDLSAIWYFIKIVGWALPYLQIVKWVDGYRYHY